MITFQEFDKLMMALNDKFPNIYPRKKQTEIAFHVSGLPLEWFKERWRYVHASRDGRYDWITAAKDAKKALAVSCVTVAQSHEGSIVQEVEPGSVQPLYLSMVSEVHTDPDCVIFEIAQALAIPKEALQSETASYQGMLEREGAKSAVELLDQQLKRRQGETP